MSDPSLVTETSSSSRIRRPEPTTPSARIRAATVRRRVLQVTDVLAAAHLLLGMNTSVRAMAATTEEGKP